MEHSLPLSHKKLPRSFVGTVLSVLAFSLSLILGILLADVFQTNGTFPHSVQAGEPYAGCVLLPDYVIRAVYLCRPAILYTIAVWLSAYVRFEKILLITLFSLRGLAFGMALRLSLALSGTLFPALFTGIHTFITLILAGLVFCIHTEDGVRPLPDSLTLMMMAGGSAVLLTLSASLLPLFFEY